MTKVSGAILTGMKLKGKNIAQPSDFASWKLGLEFSENNGSKILINGGNVETVYDQSGEGRDFTQATAGNRPAFTAGLGAIFAGGTDFLQMTTNLITDAIGTLMAVARMDAVDGNGTFLSKGDSTVSDGNAFSCQKGNVSEGNSKKTLYAAGTSPGINGSIAITDTTTFRVYVYQKNKLFLNSAEDDVTVRNNTPWFNVPSGGTQRMTIGKHAGSITGAGGIYLYGALKEMVYFDEALNNSDVVKLINGLIQKYGL